MQIPIFQEIDELHHATRTLQSSGLNDFHIYRNEDVSLSCVSSMSAHRCNFSQISIDRRSNYSLLNNAQKINTADNTIYFVGTGKLLSWQSTNPGGGWEGYNVVFKHDFLPAGINNYNFLKEFPFLGTGNRAFVKIPLENDSIFDLCERMLYEQKHEKDSNVIRHYLYALLYIIKRLYLQQHEAPAKDQKMSRETELAGRFEELINNHYLEFKSINDYAEKLFVSPKHLSQVSKNIYGKTAKEMVLNRVGEEAKSLLIQTNLTLSQVATNLEFNDTSNFIKFFRRLTGQSPTEYRRSGHFLP